MTLFPKALEEAADQLRRLEQGGKRLNDWSTLPKATKRKWCDKATAAITAYLAQREKEGFVEVPNSALAWLFGEAPDSDGHWFEPPELKEGERNKPYWWRSKLRAMLTAAQSEMKNETT